MNILLITGGTSSERGISLISAKEVKRALEKNNFKVKIFDLKKGLLALEKESQDFDVIFPVLHGEEGEGGKLQEFLMKLGKPYVGGNPKGYQEGWFKITFKKFCDKNKIPTAPWKEVREEGDILKFGFPCVIKSSNGGSSLEVVVLKTPKDLKSENFQNLMKSGASLFTEKFLPGTEVTVSVLGNRVLPILEIVPPNGNWFDHKDKYSGKTKEVIDAPSVPKKTQQKIMNIALEVHKKLKLGSLSRMDFIVSNNLPHILEVNTIPGFTPTSSFPQSAKAIGLSFEQLVKQLVETARKRY